MTLRNQLNSEVDETLRTHAWMPVISTLGIAIASLVAIAFTGWATYGFCETELSRTILLGSVILAGAGVLVFAVIEHRMIMRFEARAEKLVPESGVIEKLAMGTEQVNEIYDYTGWPWRLFLGPRPKTISRATHLVLTNLEWYLNAPGRHLNKAWVFYLAAFGGMLLFIGSMILGLYGLKNNLQVGLTGPWFLAAEVGVFIPYFWGFSHFTKRNRISAEALRLELKRRVRSNRSKD